jgi:SAM-dependent methyltransferase
MSKDSIKQFWGDTARQWYTERDKKFTAETLNLELDEVERFFKRRGQLATIEMPMDLTGKSVLEIGSGGGAHSAIFVRRGADVTAVDLTPERVESTGIKLALLGKGRALQADAEQLPFEDNTFDIVYSNGVLHHSTDTEQCIREVYRVLKPGGRAVLMLYARHSTQYWLNIWLKGLFSGRIFYMPEARWVGWFTEGKPKFGAPRNPYTRVYSERQVRKLLAAFSDIHVRKNSFRLDYFAIPKGWKLRNAVLGLFGVPISPASLILYGSPVAEDTGLELALNPIGWCLNISAVKRQP